MITLLPNNCDPLAMNQDGFNKLNPFTLMNGNATEESSSSAQIHHQSHAGLIPDSRPFNTQNVDLSLSALGAQQHQTTAGQSANLDPLLGNLFSKPSSRQTDRNLLARSNTGGGINMADIELQLLLQQQKLQQEEQQRQQLQSAMSSNLMMAAAASPNSSSAMASAPSSSLQGSSLVYELMLREQQQQKQIRDAQQLLNAQVLLSAPSPVGAQPASSLSNSHGADGVLQDLPKDLGPGMDRRHLCKQTFPEKLYNMVVEMEQEGQQNVVSFVDDGKAFLIHHPRLFESDVMPLYFSSSRMSSVQRQLNIYGFQRITEGPFRGAYRHRCFLKGQPELLKKITRSSTVGKSVAAIMKNNQKINNKKRNGLSSSS